MDTGVSRYYENEFPEVGSAVMVIYKEMTGLGVDVELLEYGNIGGLILLCELPRRRGQQKYMFRAGRQEVALVTRVGKVKGSIDLSMRGVPQEDIAKCQEKYQQGQQAHVILRQVAEKLGVPLLRMYETVAWPLARKYGSAGEAFKRILTNPEIWDDLVLPHPEVGAEITYLIAAPRRIPHPVKLRASIEVRCSGPAGIDAIQTALRAAEAVATKDTPVKVRLVKPPWFVVNSFACYDEVAGVEVLRRAIEAARDVMDGVEGGGFKVVMWPRRVGAKDEEELRMKMEEAERENREVDGDGPGPW